MIANDLRAKLYAVADDNETAVLDALLDRAGVTWTCRGPHAAGKPNAWTMEAGQPCEICGKPAPKVKP